MTAHYVKLVATDGKAHPAHQFTNCPDCDGPFTYRIRDEDTGCSYPVDDGEHYCDACDSIWTDEYLVECQPRHLGQGWSRVEL